jgi:hypothetical protein
VAAGFHTHSSDGKPGKILAMNCISLRFFLRKAFVFHRQCLAWAVHKSGQVTKVGHRLRDPIGCGEIFSRAEAPRRNATFALTDKEMVKKLSYYTIAMFIFGVTFGGVISGTHAYGLSAASGVEGIAGHLGSRFPESGSLALLGSILITGATFLRRKWATNTK